MVVRRERFEGEVWRDEVGVVLDCCEGEKVCEEAFL